MVFRISAGALRRAPWSEGAALVCEEEVGGLRSCGSPAKLEAGRE